MQSNEDVLSGTIASVDLSSATENLTLQSDAMDITAAGGELNIFLSGNTTILMCRAAGSPEDLKQGSRAIVTYHEVAGLAVADFIYKPC